jgi:hypothetical protein
VVGFIVVSVNVLVTVNVVAGRVLKETIVFVVVNCGVGLIVVGLGLTLVVGRGLTVVVGLRLSVVVTVVVGLGLLDVVGLFVKGLVEDREEGIGRKDGSC